MKGINNFLNEGIKLSSKSKINVKDEEFYEKHSELWSETQNEIEPDAAYRTYNYSDGLKKYKKGFITFNQDNEFATITAFNDVKDLIDLLGANKEDYEEYNEIEIGEVGEIYDNRSNAIKIIRIW